MSSRDRSTTEAVNGQRIMAHIGTAARGVDHTGGIGTIGVGVIGMVVTARAS